METDGGAVVIPLVIMFGAAMLLTGCSSDSSDSSDSSGSSSNTNSYGYSYSDATYNFHKKTQCDIDNSACPMGNECPFA